MRGTGRTAQPAIGHSDPKRQDAPPPLTIDELAQRVGMSVRNLREWRTFRLLPAAEMRGRVGYYDARVVARIEGIRKLRADGFTLDLIRRMLEASGDSADQVIRLADALRAPFREVAPPALDPEEWSASWGATEPGDLERAIDLGLIRTRSDGRLELASARVARVGEAMRRLGLSSRQILDATAEVRAHADGIAALFERVWLERVWQPFIDAGMPETGLAPLQRTLAEMQPLVLEAVIAIFTIAMESRIEKSITREVDRAGRGRSSSRKRRRGRPPSRREGRRSRHGSGAMAE